MKILIVHYLPSGTHSNTLQLLDFFRQNVKNHCIEELDLIENPPPFFNPKSLQAYKTRNFGGQVLSEDLKQAIAPMDKLADQFVQANLVVLATPMHNYSLPGIVKTYFDAIMQSGKVFKYENEVQMGLMKNTKFLGLYTSMASYKGEYGFLDDLKTILKIEIDFMGIVDYDFIHASTGNHFTKEVHIEKAKGKILAKIQNWNL